MKAKLTLIAAAMALSGFAFAQQDTGAATDDAARPGAGTVQDSAGQAGGDAGGAATGQVGSSLLSAIDKDADGKVSRDELTSYFDQHDANSDGNLDQSEFAAFEGGVSGGGMPMQQDQQQISPDSGSMQPSPDSGMESPPDGGGATGQ